MVTFSKIVLLAVIITMLSIGSISSSSEGTTIEQENRKRNQSTQTRQIERDLFDLINRERRLVNLQALEISPELTVIALAHSTDMAEHGYFSHESLDGRTYKDRLVNGDVYFQMAGENISYSETYMPEIIHQSLMDSPHHREEILTPAYDQVGIGVVSNDKREFYITQDFRKALFPLDSDSAEQYVRKRINHERSKNSLDPLFYHESASAEARKFSRLKVKSDMKPNIGNRYGETHIDFVVTYSLDSELIIKRATTDRYGEAGIGVHFSRNEEHPGGAYFATIYLFPRTMFRDLSPEVLNERLLSAINSFREGLGLSTLQLDSWLSQKASRIAEAGANKINVLNLGPSYLNRKIFVDSYITSDPSRLPQTTPSNLSNPSIRRIGIGVHFGRTEMIEREVYSVTLIITSH